MGRGISRICQIKNLVISNLYNVTQVRLFYALEVLMVVIFFFVPNVRLIFAVSIAC